MKVLFVPSIPFLATALKITLCKAGFTLIVSEIIDQPQQILQEVKPHLVISDITQHGGIDYVTEAKRINLPVIVVGANGKENDLQTAFDRGADDYVSLPLSITELVLRVSILAKGKITKVA